MGYKIKYTFTTIHYHDEGEVYSHGCLDHEWDRLEDAETAKERMWEHYHWLQGERTGIQRLERPEWLWSPQQMVDSGLSKFVSLDDDYSTASRFNVPGNDGQDILLSAASYCGYFENLVSATIVRVPS